MVRFNYDIQKCIGKYGRDRLIIHRSIYESSTNQVRKKEKFVAFLVNL